MSGIVDDVNKELNGAGTAENENAETTVDSVNEQVDSGAPEEDVQTVVDEAKKESETVRENVNKTFDEADKAINESLDTANQALDMLVDSVNGYDGLSDEERAGFKQEAGNIKNDIDGLRILRQTSSLPLRRTITNSTVKKSQRHLTATVRLSAIITREKPTAKL